MTDTIYSADNISTYAISIAGAALQAVNQYMSLIVVLGVIGGIAISIGLLVRNFTGIGKKF